MPSRPLPLAFVALLVALSLVAGCKTRAIYNAERVALEPVTLEERARQIERAARLQGWALETVAPGVSIATRRSGPHVAVATLTFGPERFAIDFRSSVALNHSGDRIHGRYNEWVMALERSILAEAASGAVSSGAR